ncbi:hypothetical protein CFE70_001527 [Pyrenophora teres f. teres 0-1]|uniref:Uncharacterized protein n=1 Tax=Pyrenophora teres f. teres (strain 0-1) TaxID=861557 RepID=E3S1V7_PYRTT|nr:hypothetical protein PTT_16246 [Pyrenophora teres f. teres 0-1]KAE8850853.1 hypothetical protein PTNB85_01269 [Pyrenophora teres f. teres]KAK1920322.1 hypothetical protein P3342_002618 [Pyrenophora teres f. teres]
MADTSQSSAVSGSTIPRFLYNVYNKLYDDDQSVVLAYLPVPYTLEFAEKDKIAGLPVNLYIGTCSGKCFVYPDGTVIRLTVANEAEHIKRDDPRYLASNGVPAPFGWNEDIWQGLKEPIYARSLALVQLYFLKWACYNELWHLKLPAPDYDSLLSALSALGQTDAVQIQLKENGGRVNFFNKEFHLSEFKDKIEKAEKAEKASSGLMEEAAEDHKAVVLPTKDACIILKEKTDECSVKTSIQMQDEQAADEGADDGGAQLENDVIDAYQSSDDDFIPSDGPSFQSCHPSEVCQSMHIMNNTKSDLDWNHAAIKAKPNPTEKASPIAEGPIVKYGAKPGAYGYLLHSVSEPAASFLFDISEPWLGRFEQHAKTDVAPIRFFLAENLPEGSGGNYQKQRVWAYLTSRNGRTTAPELTLEPESQLPDEQLPHTAPIRPAAKLEPERDSFNLKQLLGVLDAENWDELAAIVQFFFVLAAEKGVLEFRTHIVPITSLLIDNLDCWARRQFVKQSKKQQFAIDRINVGKTRSHKISRTVSGRVAKPTSASRRASEATPTGSKTPLRRRVRSATPNSPSGEKTKTNPLASRRGPSPKMRHINLLVSQRRVLGMQYNAAILHANNIQRECRKLDQMITKEFGNLQSAMGSDTG